MAQKVAYWSYDSNNVYWYIERSGKSPLLGLLPVRQWVTPDLPADAISIGTLTKAGLSGPVTWKISFSSNDPYPYIVWSQLYAGAAYRAPLPPGDDNDPHSDQRSHAARADRHGLLHELAARANDLGHPGPDDAEPPAVAAAATIGVQWINNSKTNDATWNYWSADQNEVFGRLPAGSSTDVKTLRVVDYLECELWVGNFIGRQLLKINQPGRYQFTLDNKA